MPTTLEEAICIIKQLQAENAALKQQITELTEHLAPAHQPEAKARPRITASVPKREPQPRRKRDPQHNRGRKRQEPTRIQTHACDSCPLGLLYAPVKGHPCQARSKRLLCHEDELFPFVLVAGLSADNTQAERSIRPLVDTRKISGGSRSEAGTKTRLGLASLFETWLARGLNAFQECLRALGALPADPAPAISILSPRSEQLHT